MQPRRVYSALDLGTNNCRLLIARPDANGFRVIDAFSRIVRLGEGVLSTGSLSQNAMQRTIEALKVCAEKVERRQVTLMRNVATQACRMAENCGEFVETVREETGLALDIISPKEEARLAVMGCKSLINPDAEQSLVFDIGGGSTELILVDRKDGELDIANWISLPIGVVTLAERFGTHAMAAHEYAEMVEFVRDELVEFNTDCQNLIANGSARNLLGTSGTVTTLASLQLGLKVYNRNKVDGAWLTSDSVRTLSAQLSAMSCEERTHQGCIGRERADLVVAGCAILEAILDLWPTHKLRVADRGIREGVLRGLMRADGLDV
jgi:exopolyphosphatase/guanosine-5'-triphosphate,3'-diphosphate pyrophosphatase